MLRNLFNGVILNLSFGILQAFGSETQARRDGELAESISGSRKQRRWSRLWRDSMTKRQN